MHAFMQPQLVGSVSANSKFSALPIKGENAVQEAKFLQRFLAVLLTCLSAWGT